MPNGNVYAGAQAPETFALTVTTGKSGVDMTTVTAVTLRVRRENGETRYWDTALSGATPNQLVATHTFAADGNDVPRAETLRVMPLCTVAGGVVRGHQINLIVSD